MSGPNAVAEVVEDAMRQLTTRDVLAEVLTERQAQHEKWGEQNHPDMTGFAAGFEYADMCRWTFDPNAQKHMTDGRSFDGNVGYSDILAEEVAETFAEDEPGKLRAELIQVAAVAVAWIEKLDRDIAQQEREDAARA